MLGSSLLFGPSDEDWRQKRKACAHAFYKDRLKLMVEMFKKLIDGRFTEWDAKIEAATSSASEGEQPSLTINIVREF